MRRGEKRKLTKKIPSSDLIFNGEKKRKKRKESKQKNPNNEDASKEGRTSGISDSGSPGNAASASSCSLIRGCHSFLNIAGLLSDLEEEEDEEEEEKAGLVQANSDSTCFGDCYTGWLFHFTLLL